MSTSVQLSNRFQNCLLIILVVILGILLVQPLNARRKLLLETEGKIQTPAWNQSGNEIYYGIVPEDRNSSVIQKIGVQNKKKKTVVDYPGKNLQPMPVPESEDIRLMFFNRSEDGAGRIMKFKKGGLPEVHVGKDNFQGWAEDPTLHPRGKPLAFFGRKRNSASIWLRSKQGRYHQVTNGENFQFSPSWGVHGQSLLYVEKDENLQLKQHHIRTAQTKTLYESNFLLQPVQHPTTLETVFVTRINGQLQLKACCNSKTGRKLVTGLSKVTSPALSPSGTRIAYVSKTSDVTQLWIEDFKTPWDNVPHTIRFDNVRAMQTIPAGKTVKGVVTGTVSVNGTERLRRADTTVIQVKYKDRTKATNRYNKEVRGTLITVPEDMKPGSIFTIKVSIEDERGRTTRSIPLKFGGVRSE
ncbi:MAG: hypothetical protein ABEJ65_11050 [bacterium]